MSEQVTPPEAFGDRYFWPMVMLLGLGLVVVPLLLEFRFPFNAGGSMVLLGLLGWLRQRHDTAR